MNAVVQIAIVGAGLVLVAEVLFICHRNQRSVS